MNRYLLFAEAFLQTQVDTMFGRLLLLLGGSFTETETGGSFTGADVCASALCRSAESSNLFEC